MAKKTQEQVAEIVEGQEVPSSMEGVPDWAMADLQDSQVELYKPPAAVQTRRALRPDELIAYVASQVNSYEDDDPRMALEIAAQIVNMDTAEKVLSGGAETVKGREITDTALRCDAIKFIMSTEPQGCPYFAILSVAIPSTGKEEVISVGGWRLVLQLGQLHYLSAELPEGSPYLVPEGTPGAMQKETYPHFMKIMKAPTSSGRSMNYLTTIHR